MLALVDYYPYPQDDTCLFLVVIVHQSYKKKHTTQIIREEEKYERWDEKRKRCTGVVQQELERSVFVNHTKKAKYKSKTKSKVSHDLPRRRMLHKATPKLILLMLLMLLH